MAGGLATNKEVSAIDKANTPFIDSLYTKYKHQLGFRDGCGTGGWSMGNSRSRSYEFRSGRVVYQDLVKLIWQLKMAQLKKMMYQKEL